ncbi:putative signal-transduction protein containing cAMP-binding and CBS domains [Candidatus Nitrososphaera evergladensis SR1]|uniref:Putative signal-transduction protein containing cAMP-binding and CBS domains n=1 Tax=Candidatus Nitrososphaera evergladensis SR1 TaxID=1459636 RepID=A0A075MN63_9ARCH|nr:CBS domain-containing protein [Candidatus Nitrososphaera evergladensis]AIF82971.1 putative signal-transduction protein containing cAMP-binding and CBS domains [Candidatus Nitrososphaera evergladensis SR1]
MQADLERKVGELATPEILVMDELSTVAQAAKAMKKKDSSSVFVSRGSTKDLVGIITERDILYRVVAENMGPFKTTLKEVMSAPLIIIDYSATVLEAILLMRKEGIRRLPVRRDGGIVGVVTLLSITGNIPSKSVEAGQVETSLGSSGIACPYCGSGFESKKDLSKHIDRLHIGSGLLEGDLRQI